MFAKAISAIASPFIVIPVFALWVIRFHSLTLNNFFVWGATFTAITVILPFFYVYNGVKTGQLTDFHVTVREQRFKPLLFTLICNLLLIAAFYLESAPRTLIVLAVTLFFNGIVFIMVTRFWKISGHAASYFGSVLVVMFLIKPSLYWLFVFLPFIIWSRIERDRHTIGQTLIACLLVAITTITSLFFFGSL